MKDILKIFDLQLFATQKTTTNETGNDLSPEMKTYYHDRLIDNAEPALVYDQFGSKYPIPAHGGKTIEFRKYSPLKKATGALTEGVTPSGNKLNVTTITATIAQYGDFIEISDLLETTAIDRNIEEATKLLGSQAGRTMDTITREVVCAGTNKMFAPIIGDNNAETEVLLRESVTTACKLTPKVIRKAVAKLKRENTNPINGSYICIIHPDVTCDLTGDEEWIEAHKYARPEEIYNGEIGKLAGVRFVESTEAKIIAPADIFTGVNRLTLKTALDSSGSTTIAVKEKITAAQAAELTAAIAAGTVKIWVGGKEATLASVTAGDAGSAYFTASAVVKSVSADAVVCGQGAGKLGAAIYCTMLIGANAYGTTEVSGMGLQHIVKQMGSSGTADPLNQRATTGWKATKTAERLVEEYMIRIEHSSENFGATANAN